MARHLLVLLSFTLLNSLFARAENTENTPKEIAHKNISIFYSSQGMKSTGVIEFNDEIGNTKPQFAVVDVYGAECSQRFQKMSLFFFSTEENKVVQADPALDKATDKHPRVFQIEKNSTDLLVQFSISKKESTEEVVHEVLNTYRNAETGGHNIVLHTIRKYNTGTFIPESFENCRLVITLE